MCGNFKSGLLYGTLKVHKLYQQQQERILEELKMRPVTATYDITKYLNKLLTPSIKSKYNMLNPEELLRRLRKETVPTEYKKISFDVKSLLTNVALDKTLDLILQKRVR